MFTYNLFRSSSYKLFNFYSKFLTIILLQNHSRHMCRSLQYNNSFDCKGNSSLLKFRNFWSFQSDVYKFRNSFCFFSSIFNDNRNERYWQRYSRIMENENIIWISYFNSSNINFNDIFCLQFLNSKIFTLKRQLIRVYKVVIENL